MKSTTSRWNPSHILLDGMGWYRVVSNTYHIVGKATVLVGVYPTYSQASVEADKLNKIAEVIES